MVKSNHYIKENTPPEKDPSDNPLVGKNQINLAKYNLNSFEINSSDFDFYLAKILIKYIIKTNAYGGMLDLFRANTPEKENDVLKAYKNMLKDVLLSGLKAKYDSHYVFLLSDYAFKKNKRYYELGFNRNLFCHVLRILHDNKFITYHPQEFITTDIISVCEHKIIHHFWLNDNTFNDLKGMVLSDITPIEHLQDLASFKSDDIKIPNKKKFQIDLERRIYAEHFIQGYNKLLDKSKISLIHNGFEMMPNSKNSHLTLWFKGKYNFNDCSFSTRYDNFYSSVEQSKITIDNEPTTCYNATTETNNFSSLSYLMKNDILGLFVNKEILIKCSDKKKAYLV